MKHNTENIVLNILSFFVISQFFNPIHWSFKSEYLAYYSLMHAALDAEK